MQSHLLKRILPFALMFLVGAALGSLPAFFGARYAKKQHVVEFQRAHRDTDVVVRKRGCRAYRRNFNTQAHGWTRILSTENASDGRFTNRKYTNRQGWTSASILYRPNPQYTEAARQAGTGGVVRLHVTFGADGKVSDIQTISELPDGLTEEAIDAAERIRFMPSTLNGQPVSTQGTIDFLFHPIRTEQCEYEH
ncbi:MAG TPA: energy transducer TonB [Pyrinomonadaceae bacterium]|jgi:TonB family protein